MSKNIEYPSEVMFKSVFRNTREVSGELYRIMEKKNIECDICHKSSNSGKFTSYTITAVFTSHDELQEVCNEISSLKDHMMLF